MMVSWGWEKFLQVSALASHLLEDCANCTPTPEENYKYSANRSWFNVRQPITRNAILIRDDYDIYINII
jgi:hypothetical protein